MKKSHMIFLFLFSSSIHAAPAWILGTVDKTEVFPDKIVVRWQASDNQECGSDDAVFTLTSMENEIAYQQAFSVALSAAASGKPIKLRVDGCENNLQKATGAQLCATESCTY